MTQAINSGTVGELNQAERPSDFEHLLQERLFELLLLELADFPPPVEEGEDPIAEPAEAKPDGERERVKVEAKH
jgi:hypothetical protein